MIILALTINNYVYHHHEFVVLFDQIFSAYVSFSARVPIACEPILVDRESLGIRDSVVSEGILYEIYLQPLQSIIYLQTKMFSFMSI